MIKIDKDLSNIPDSLLSEEVHNKRLSMMKKGKYIKNVYHRSEDVLSELKKIYGSKCVYCERYFSDTIEVEHYRPKAVYYLLSLSWDNLQLICSKCNKNKSQCFDCYANKEISGTYDLSYSLNLVKNINRCSEYLDVLERPKLVNLEKENPSPHISFSLDGIISSEDERYRFTIDKIKLNREEILTERKTLLDKLKNCINDIIKDSKTKDELIRRIKFEISKFENEQSFVAFRRYIINNFLRDILMCIVNHLAERNKKQ